MKRVTCLRILNVLEGEFSCFSRRMIWTGLGNIFVAWVMA